MLKFLHYRNAPLYKNPSVQRFIAGITIGFSIGWFFFLYQHGQAYEQALLRLYEQEAKNRELQQDLNELVSEQRKENEENQKNLTIQEIELQFTHGRQLRLSQLTLLELKEQALHELQFVKRKEIEAVSDMSDLVISLLENKVFVVEEQRFQLKVEQFHLSTTLKIKGRILPAKH
ncbi:sporulation membrane protein YtrI [Halalkalibacterium halodurans]|uniref:sporulation membrane protein YtrI n=1 Tax=Halalkalibacterium halodurans TaxID=86665 RepID=UPI0011802C5A|nr:sporulation membrane protein YtrI [Halalkalibacterium halodurans]